MPTPSIIDASRKLLGELKDTTLPAGTITAKMDDELENGKGLGVLLRGLADYIDLEQNIADQAGNEPLIQRLRGEDGKEPIANIVTDIAISGMGEDTEDVGPRVTKLQEALKVRGNDVLGEAERAIKTIAREKGLEFDDAVGREKRRVKGAEEEERKEDEGTWRESTHLGADEKPLISDEEIRRSASENKDGIDDEAIRGSAQSGEKEFRPKKERSEYEETVRGKDNQYLGNQYDAKAQARKYHELVRDLRADFSVTVGKHMGGRGLSPQ